MAIQIFDQTTSFGERLGQALGTGLGGLAADYNAKQAANKYKQSLMPYFGEGIANLLSMASPEERKFLYQNIPSLMQLEDERKKELSAKNAEARQRQQFEQQQKEQSVMQQALQQLSQEQQGLEKYIGEAPNIESLDVFNQLQNQNRAKLGQPLLPTTTNRAVEQMISQAQRQKEAQPLLDQYRNAYDNLQQLANQQSQMQLQQTEQSGMPELTRQPSIAESRARLFESPQARLQREQFELSKQEALNKRYKTYTNEIQEVGKPAAQLYDAIKNAVDLVKSGQALTGVAGKFTPTYLQTDEGQQLVAALNDIVLKRDALAAGRPSVQRLKLSQLAKAGIQNSPKAIESILRDAVDDPEFLRDISTYMAYRELQPTFAGELPKDYEKQILSKAKQVENDLKEDIKSLFEGVPAQVGQTVTAGDKKYIYAKGTIGIDQATGKQVMFDGKEWRPV